MNAKYDLVETANQTGNFRIFLQALEAADLKETLKKTGPYTLLAPVDDAFVKMPQTTLHNLFKSDNRESLQSLLRNHIISGDLASKQLKTQGEMSSITGDALKIESRAGLWVNEAQVITPDLEASNGVIHGIDTVLMPKTQAAGEP
jgi:uncharacterized surface protein with fasciclin (FAS1) repeats